MNEKDVKNKTRRLLYVSAPSCCAFTHRVAFEEVSGHRVLIIKRRQREMVEALFRRHLGGKVGPGVSCGPWRPRTLEANDNRHLSHLRVTRRGFGGSPGVVRWGHGAGLRAVLGGHQAGPLTGHRRQCLVGLGPELQVVGPQVQLHRVAIHLLVDFQVVIIFQGVGIPVCGHCRVARVRVPAEREKRLGGWVGPGAHRKLETPVPCSPGQSSTLCPMGTSMSPTHWLGT